MRHHQKEELSLKKTSRGSKPSKLGGKLGLVGKTLGLIEEKGKSKDWILEQLKNKKIKLKVSPTANSYEILNSCPLSFIKRIFKILSEDIFGISEIKTLTKTFHWFFTDIVSSSDPTINTKAQVRKINVLNSLVNNTETFKKRNTKSTVIYWSGDGMAIGFADSPENPLRIAIELHKELAKYNKTVTQKNRVSIRVGINTGPVYMIKDVEGNDAIWGEGIVIARRVMDLCGADQIFASSKIASDIRTLSPEYKGIMHSIGNYTVKHGLKLEIFNVFGRGFGEKSAPQHGKVSKRKLETKELSNETSFKFKNIDINLDVLNQKDMMTRHTWIWTIQNVKKDTTPLEELFYALSGDTAREFSDLHLKVKDDENRTLKVSSISKNKPYLKEFYVKFAKPIAYLRKQTLSLSYDWEEPDRNFGYTISSECEKFRFKLRVPKKLEIKSRILKVNLGTKEKLKVKNPAEIKYGKNKTEVNWETRKPLKEFDSFEFYW